MFLFTSRYIEIFKSSLAEARSAMAPRMRGPMGGMGGGMGRPGPYDRGDRFGGGNMGGGGGGFGGGGGGGGGGGYSRGRGRNIKGQLRCLLDFNMFFTH